MVHKFSYCTQKNTPCNINAQRWYLVSAINKYKTATNPVLHLCTFKMPSFKYVY